MTALAYTVITCAALHLVVSYAYALTTGAYQVVNMFNIIGLSLVFPALGQTVAGFWASQVATTALFVAWLLWVRHRVGHGRS